jgi:hypothetical protein
MDRYHAEHHAQPEICTEQGSFVSTRGIYANDRAQGYIPESGVKTDSRQCFSPVFMRF